MDNFKVYTDGGSSGNPGPGGWAYVVSDGENIIARGSGGDYHTTNNKMELQAVIEALEYFKKQQEQTSVPIVIHTDSQYVRQGITGWIKSWLKNGWKTAAKKPVKNKEYWVKLKQLDDALKPQWKWVPGHAGVELNEVCDALVQDEIRKIAGDIKGKAYSPIGDAASEPENAHVYDMISQLLSQQLFAVLSTQGKEGVHAVIVLFAAADHNRNILFVTPRKTRKFFNMKRNDRVTLFVDNRSQNISELQHLHALQVVGEVRELLGESRKQGQELYIGKFPDLKEFALSPENALMCIAVGRFEVVTQFQQVVVLENL